MGRSTNRKAAKKQKQQLLPKPVPSGGSPFNVFPPEVWMEIFEPLETPADVLACSRVCSSFQQMIRPKLVQCVFPEILKHVEKYLDKTSLLQCRRVCKSWKAGIDNFGDANFCSDREDETDGRSLWQYTYVFFCRDDLIDFMDTMQGSTNPFITPSVSFEASCIHQNEDEDDSRFLFWMLVGDFLRHFGGHIKQCRFHIEVNPVYRPFVFFYENVLLDCLSSLPRLRLLIVNLVDTYSLIENDIARQQLVYSDIVHVIGSMANCPIPHLRDIIPDRLLPIMGRLATIHFRQQV